MKDSMRSPEEWLDFVGMTRHQARERCQTDLYFLLTQVLGYTYYYAPLHQPLCRKYEERHALSMWLIPRDHLKSTTFTVGASIQEVLIDPNITICISSAKMDNSLAFMRDIKKHFVKNDRLLYLYPEYRIEAGKEGKINEWDVPARTSLEAREFTFTAAAVDTSVVSKHFDIIKLDDLVNDQNARTAEGLQKVKDHFRNVWPLLRPGHGRLVVIGTRWDQADAYGMIEEDMRDEGAYFCVMSAWKRDGHGGLRAIYPRSDYGQPFYTVDILKSRRRKMKDYFFSCQFLNDPMPDRENRILHPRQLQWVKELPDNCFHFIFCDPSISAREEADRCALLCVAMDWMKNIYVVDCIAGHLAPSVLAQWVYEYNQLYKPRFTMMESLQFQDVYRQHIQVLIQQNGGNVSIQEVPRKGNEEKVRRIFGLQPWFEQGKIFFLKGGRGVQDVVDECLKYSKKLSKRQRDDICDALSDAIVYCYSPPRARSPFDDQPVSEHFALMDRLEMSSAFGADDFCQAHLEGFGGHGTTPGFSD